MGTLARREADQNSFRLRTLVVTIKIKALGGNCCPVRALGDYFALRGSDKGNVFRFQDGKPVPYVWYTKIVKLLVARVGLSPFIKPHSARIRWVS